MLQIAESWLIRKKQFKVTAKMAVMHALILQGGMVMIGVFYPEAPVLIVLSAFAIGFKAAMMTGFSRKSGLLQLPARRTHRSVLKKLAAKHQDFPFYRAPEVLIDAVSQGMPVLLLAGFLGPVSAGFYSTGYNVLSIPSQLIRKFVGNVFYP